MTGQNESCGESIETRITRFLIDWTAPLLSAGEQHELVNLFGQLVGESLSQDYGVERWDSDLTPGGVPIELSSVVDPEGAGSVRFTVDTQPGPQDSARARAVIRDHAEMVVPRSASSSDLIDLLLARHLAEVPDFSRSYVGFGARFATGKPRAGRLYFKTWWMPSWGLFRTLSGLVQNEGLRLFRSSFLGQQQIQGVGYDFDTRGLARVKIYVWAGAASKEAGPALAAVLPGLSRAPLDELVNLVMQSRRTSTAAPPVLLGVGFAPTGDYCDLKVCFLANAWGWKTFHDLQPVLLAILGHWGVRTDFDPPDGPKATPWWRFAPTWISIDASPRQESLSIYFAPVRMPIESRGALSSPLVGRADASSNKPSTVFEMMYSRLLASEAPAESVPRRRQT